MSNIQSKSLLKSMSYSLSSVTFPGNDHLENCINC